jgi:hypothetical protein
MSKYKLLMLTAMAATALGSVPAAAITTFAAFSPSDTNPNVRYTDGLLYTAIGGVGGPSSVDVLFTILVGGIPALQGVSASYTLNAAIPAGTLPVAGPFNLESASGGFSILSNTAINAGGMMYAAGSNLLSGSFVGGFLDGTIDGTSGVVRGSTDGGVSITYTSDFLDFTDVTQFDFSLPLTAVTLSFGPAGGTIRDFNASMGGQFASQPAPGVPGVPEPTTWAMLVLGFGLVGVTARRRKMVTVAA